MSFNILCSIRDELQKHNVLMQELINKLGESEKSKELKERYGD